MSAPDTTVLCACWPIIDEDQTMGELRATAQRDLVEMLFTLKVQAAGSPRWDVINPDDERPLLIMSMPVQPWRDPVRHRARRSTTPAEVAS